MMLTAAHKHVGDQGKPGQIVNPVHQGKSMMEEIEQYKLQRAYNKGYDEGREDQYRLFKNLPPINRTSEYDR